MKKIGNYYLCFFGDRYTIVVINFFYGLTNTNDLRQPRSYCFLKFFFFIKIRSIFSRRKLSCPVGEPTLGPGVRIRSWLSAHRVPITICSRLRFRVPEARNRVRVRRTRRTGTKGFISQVRFSDPVVVTPVTIGNP